MRTLILAALAAALLLAGGLIARPALAARGHARAGDPCAGALCLKDRPGTKSCHRFRERTAVARCFVIRAARHYHQSVSLALYTARVESRYRWWVTNGSGHRGMFQFDDALWGSTPYARRHRSPYEPRFAALAAMRIWAHGGYHHWGCCE